MFKQLTFFVLIAVFGVSCGPDYLVEQSHQFGEAGWTYADSVSFDFEIADTSKRYTLWFTVHHSPAYDNENLYVKFTTVFPKGQETLDGSNQVEQVTSLKLASTEGLWLGKCSGDECVMKIPIQTKTWFPDPGKYSLKVAQYMRRDSLTNIKSIDFAIENPK